jgi:hypothetical protein
MSYELEELVQLVRDAGLSTGHADDAVSLMREVLAHVDELRAKLARALEAELEIRKAMR